MQECKTFLTESKAFSVFISVLVRRCIFAGTGCYNIIPLKKIFRIFLNRVTVINFNYLLLFYDAADDNIKKVRKNQHLKIEE